MIASVSNYQRWLKGTSLNKGFSCLYLRRQSPLVSLLHNSVTQVISLALPNLHGLLVLFQIFVLLGFLKQTTYRTNFAWVCQSTLSCTAKVPISCETSLDIHFLLRILWRIVSLDSLLNCLDLIYHIVIRKANESTGEALLFNYLSVRKS